MHKKKVEIKNIYYHKGLISKKIDQADWSKKVCNYNFELKRKSFYNI